MPKKLVLTMPVLMLAGFAVLALSTHAMQSTSPWNSSQTITTQQLARMLSGDAKAKPMVLQVGFQFLYHNGHIPGSIWAGPASDSDGILRLESAVKDIPRSQEIVLYCGCCPWTECPNVKPAFTAMERLKFTNVKVLYIPNNFEQDWIKKGFPVQRKSNPTPK